VQLVTQVFQSFYTLKMPVIFCGRYCGYILVGPALAVSGRLYGLITIGLRETVGSDFKEHGVFHLVSGRYGFCSGTTVASAMEDSGNNDYQD
jgi:hypothetical protein